MRNPWEVVYRWYGVDTSEMNFRDIEMKVREIVCKRWLLDDTWKGITLYPFIFYNGKPTKTLRKHEWVHVDQVRRDGWFKFYWNYVQQMRKPYSERKYEIEAKQIQRKRRELPEL